MKPSIKRKPSRKQVVFIVILALFMLLLVAFNATNASVIPASSIELVSVSSSGSLGNDRSSYGDISNDGIVVFDSFASNLVAGDTNGTSDVFFHDTGTGTTKRVSVSASGQQGNDASELPVISDNGRYIAFRSIASNLVSGDTNNTYDVFVYDRITEGIERVSVSSSGAQGNAGSFDPSISNDGRYVAFSSSATNFSANDLGSADDIYVRDRQTNQTQLVSINSQGVKGNSWSFVPAISGNGQFVAFLSYANNLVTGDTNNSGDVFVYNRNTGTTVRRSVDSGGVQSETGGDTPSISSDGRYLAFVSSGGLDNSGNEHQVFVHDSATNQTTWISTVEFPSSHNSGESQISDDGNYVVFRTEGHFTNYPNVSGYQIYRYSRLTNAVVLVSENNGAFANSDAWKPALSNDGSLVVFETWADNLVGGDTNNMRDIFLWRASSPPLAPTLNSISNSDQNGEYTVSWSSSTGAVDYLLQEQLNNGSWSTLDIIVSTSYVVSGRSNGSWCYRVQARNTAGGSTWSNTQCATVNNPTPPAAPTLNTIANSDQNGAYTVSWSSSAGAVDYLLQEQLNNGSWSTLDTIVGTSYAVSGRSNGSWCYRVQARNTAGNSPWSNIQCTTVNIVFAISGRVTENGTGNPITGVTITTNKGQTAITNSNGNYTINGLAPDTYTVAASKSGYGFVPVAPSVTVPPSRTGVDFIGATETYSISGRVTENGTGNPISGVTITTNRGQTDVTNSNGYYTISSLAPDTYTFVASKSGYGFVPIAPSITVPPSQTDVNFIGDNGQSQCVTLNYGLNNSNWGTVELIETVNSVKCPTDSTKWQKGSSIVLSATSKVGYEFTSWAGVSCDVPNCEGFHRIAIGLDYNRNVTANFVKESVSGKVLDVRYVDQVYVQQRLENGYWNHCGPSSLAMLLYYQGLETRDVFYNRQATLDLICNVKNNCRGGSVNTKIRNVMIDKGLTSSFIDYTPTLNQIKQSIDNGYPVIFSITDANHILVITGYDTNNRIIVNDPYGGYSWWDYGYPNRRNLPPGNIPKLLGESVAYTYGHDIHEYYAIFVGDALTQPKSVQATINPQNGGSIVTDNIIVTFPKATGIQINAIETIKVDSSFVVALTPKYVPSNDTSLDVIDVFEIKATNTNGQLLQESPQAFDVTINVNSTILENWRETTGQTGVTGTNKSIHNAEFVLLAWDENNQTWLELPFELDEANGTINASYNQFTEFVVSVKGYSSVYLPLIIK